MVTVPSSTIELRAPFSGVLVPIDQVPDAVFAGRLAGDGVAIAPESRTLLAPCAGTLVHLHEARHALTLRTADGLDVLLHVGLDTVALGGRGFRALAGVGDEVAAGTPLLDVDLEFVAAHARSLLTQVVVTTPDRVARLRVFSGRVEAGRDVVAEIEVRAGAEPAPQPVGPADPSAALVVRLPAGLHVRPAAAVALAARRARGRLVVACGPREADARSVVSLLALDAGPGAVLRIAGWGDDALAAVAHAAAVLEADTGPEPGTVGPPPDEAQSREVPTPAPGASPRGAPLAFHGVCASPGEAAGRLVRILPQRIAAADPDRSPERARRQLLAALAETRATLADLQQRLAADTDPRAASVLGAQAAMLDDPDLLDLALEGVAAGRGAAPAWQQAIEVHAARLEALRRPALADRARDLRDAGARVARALAGRAVPPPALPADSVVVAHDLAPSDLAALDRTALVAVCTTAGGATSHVALLARALDLPALVGLDARALDLPDGTAVAVDATRGVLHVAPSADLLARLARRRAARASRRLAERAHAQEPAVTRDGTSVVVTGNIGGEDEARALVAAGGEGVGLLRTEWLFARCGHWPAPQDQADALSAIARVLGPARPLTVRVLDAGGDAPLPGLPVAPEPNPLLGERGIRLLLAHPALLRDQLRAVLRASADGALRVMFPMVSQLGEWRAAKAVLDHEAARLGVAPVPAGVMVEVPSVALQADAFAREVDFFSIGTNDLAQYVLAMDRTHPSLAARLDALHPAVLRLVAATVAAAHARGRRVAVCGALAADPQAVPVLVGLGIDELSVAVPAIPGVKAQVRTLDAGRCRELATCALAETSAEAVRALVPVDDTAFTPGAPERPPR